MLTLNLGKNNGYTGSIVSGPFLNPHVKQREHLDSKIKNMANIFNKFRWQCISSDLKIQAKGDKYSHHATHTVSASVWEAAAGVKEVTKGPRNRRASWKSTGGHPRNSSWNWDGTCPSKSWVDARKPRGKAWSGQQNSSGLSNRIFYHNRNVLHFCTQLLVATCGQWALEMWPVCLRNQIFKRIFKRKRESATSTISSQYTIIFWE